MIQKLTELPSLSLYIHIPWCLRKCPYCDFNSHAWISETELPEESYIQALLQDLKTQLPEVQGREVSSIFIGGGTPSLFSGPSIEHLLSGIQSVLTWSSSIEITLEANPGTAEALKFKAFKKAGINRLSLGIQSFNDIHLNHLGRIHDASQAKQAFYIAREAGFENINLDLMFALPHQNLDQALKDLDLALELSPEHLSWYQLSLEPHTPFAYHPPPLPSEDLSWEIQISGQDSLKKAGYEHYEVSAYCKGAHYAQHNLNYWTFEDYLGIGAGAHSKITSLEHQNIKRIWKIKNPKAYLKAYQASQQSGLDSAEIGYDSSIVPKEELAFEFMLNALRLYRKVNFHEFELKTGLSRVCIQQALIKAQNQGLITMKSEYFETTQLGKDFMNEVILLFLNH